MNEETEQYWPEDGALNENYVEEEFSVDQEEEFDVVRANITNSNLNDLIRRACDKDELSPRKKKWTLNELDFIEGTK